MPKKRCNCKPRKKDVKFGLYIALFLKCVIFSFLVTASVLCCTNYREMAYIFNIIRASVVLRIQGLSHFSSAQFCNDGSKDAIIYTLDISEKCHSARSGSESSKQTCRDLITKEIKDAFDRDGVVAIRGLLSSQEMDSLDLDSMELMGIEFENKIKAIRPIKLSVDRGTKPTGRQFISSRHHAVFEKDLDGFRNVALKSLLPQVASELLGMSDTSPQDGRNLRLVRDIFLAKDQDPYICGWHVDDIGFWPTTFESTGINAWVAIDAIPESTGGGFAVAVGSHIADWRWEAYKLTGSTATLPEEGYINAEDLFRKRGDGTCNIKNASPELHKKIEASKRIYDVQRGDVIFHTRWLFHRTEPVHRDLAHELNRERSKIVLRRYSLRYSPGDAVLVKGYGTELSTLYDESYGGKTLDFVSAVDGPWYPKCWPDDIPDTEMNRLHEIKDKMDSVEHKRKQRMKEMRPYLQEIGKQQTRKLINDAMHIKNMKNKNVEL